METEIVGRVADPETRKLEPITVPIAAYTIDGEEVVERFEFRPVMPAGAMLRAFQAISPNGVLSSGPIGELLERSLLNEDERARFRAFLDRDDLQIPAELLVDIYRTVTAAWSGRPTPRRSGSAPGGSQTKRTSRAGQRSRASTA
ncbi:MAG: hypothetical protein ACLPZR_06565 [Solirubrobacteraceae bacterium]|jgi:hypothetical protein